MQRLLWILVSLACLTGTRFASAVCLSPSSTNPNLFSELVTWSTSNDTTITIKLEQGTYNIGLGLDQRGPGDHVCCGSGGFNAGLVLKGGYKPNTNCDENQRSLDARLTVLDGGGGGFFLWFNGPMTVSVLTFRNYLGGNGVTLFGLTGTDNPLVMTHIIGAGNARMEMDGSSVTAQDVLVYGQPASAEAALSLTATDTAVTATHLTIVGNGGPGLDVSDQYQGNLPISIFNSIFFANAQGDIVGYDVNDNNGVFVTNSIANVSTTPGDADFIPINHLLQVFETDPLFHDSANEDFTLETNPLSLSPAINAGTNAVIGGEPATDIAGNPRIIGGLPDLGAFESPTSFFATYTVTTKQDNGDNANPTADSLRWAIKSARQSALAHSAGLPHRIVFNIPSGCPSLIVPSPAGSAFPAIDFDLTIDATTQPGWEPNTTLQGFNASLCIGINGSAVYPNAFRTAAGGRLTVLGMRFGGFADAAIRLDGGSGHQIYGNQIGGAGIGLLQTNSSNHDGVRITGATGTSFVGTFDDASTRNLIIDNSDVGVYLDSFTSAATPGSYIVNNLFGLGTNGSSPIPNGSGIFINGSPRHIVEYNTISASTGAGVTISGANAQFNTIKFNGIGTGEAGTPIVANGTQAIAVNTAAANNTLGGSTGGNHIAATGQGVYISPSGGTGNRILTNTYLYISSLPIDLGAAGTTPNDLGDGDGGPDNQQNFPVVLHAYRTNSYEWIEGTLDTFSNMAFRLEFYRNSCCVGSYNFLNYIGHDSSAVTTGFGHAHFWTRLPAPAGGTPLGNVGGTAMAANGDTSEIGPAVFESTDMIFRDDLDHAN